MELEFGKCVVVNMEERTLVHYEGIELPNEMVREGEERVIGVEGTRRREMEDKARKGYFRRVKEVLKSRLDGGMEVVNFCHKPSSDTFWGS